MIARSITGLVGDTPMIRLNRASEETGCEILGKCEFLNPGGSIKDRAAFAIIERSEEHTSELQSHAPISYAVFCLKKKK